MNTPYRAAILEGLQIASHGGGADIESLCQLRDASSTFSRQQIGDGVASFNRQRRANVLIHSS